MARIGSPTADRLSRRMCLSCGFAGAAIQSDEREQGWACPRCHADLYARPPRSYAELEGLTPAPERRPAIRESSAARCGGSDRGSPACAAPMLVRSARGLAHSIILAAGVGAVLGGLILWAMVGVGIL